MSPQNYSCGHCPSGRCSADTTRAELLRHMRMTHNAIVIPSRLKPLARVSWQPSR